MSLALASSLVSSTPPLVNTYFFEIAETISVMLLICGFAVDFNFFTANPQMFAVRNRSANPQTKTLSPQFADLRTCGPVCGSAQHCSLGISKYVIRLRLSRLLSNMTIGSNILSKCIFVSEYFRVECCCKISERSQLKNFGVEKLATPQCSNSKTFQAKATLRF